MTFYWFVIVVLIEESSVIRSYQDFNNQKISNSNKPFCCKFYLLHSKHFVYNDHVFYPTDSKVQNPKERDDVIIPKDIAASTF